MILAGSRTGSSYLFKALSQQGRFISPAGEETPFYRQAGVGLMDGPGHSDEIVSAPANAVLDLIGENLLSDLGLAQDASWSNDLLAQDFLKRLEIQWPKALDQEAKGAWQKALTQRFQAQAEPDGATLYGSWIEELERNGHPVQAHLLGASGQHPEKLALIEEPPYVAPVRRAYLEKVDFDRAPLLLKTSTNLYRLPLLKALFPNATFKWILLYRNPAATISALIDGWRSSAFHSYDVSKFWKLNIEGYSNQVPGGERYWKFDLPPGWLEYRERALEDVCAFQWISACRKMGSLKSSLESFHEVSYEKLLAEPSDTLRSLCRFSEVEWSPSAEKVAPIMTVEPPQTGKWKKRFALINKTIHEFSGGEILSRAQNLGYQVRDIEAWP